MDGTSKKAPAAPEPTTPEADDPAYVAWVNEKIRQGQQDLRDPARRHSEEQIWREHGFDDKS